MSLIYHTSGHLAGKYTADNGGDVSPSVRASLTLQRNLIKRMEEPAFADAVRLAARADSEIDGGETALEQIHRHRLHSDITADGMVMAQDVAIRIALS